MTKEEKIKELKEIYKDDEFLLRSELISLEHNNGWIRIESKDDLPKEKINCYIYYTHCQGFPQIGIDMFHPLYNRFESDELLNITHYKPIITPKTPIY